MTPEVEAAFRSPSNSDIVRSVNYWDKLQARSAEQVFQRFLFAFCSVHTTWESNVNGYLMIKDFECWLGKPHILSDLLVISGVGLHNNRTKFISAFADLYWRVPSLFRRKRLETWSNYRDRLEHNIIGLGHAKTSFALELAYPLEAEVLCMDVHVCRMYGCKQEKLKPEDYKLYERDWIARARGAVLPSFVVKQLWWDTKQGRPDSRYWSYVFEKPGSRQYCL